MTELHELPVPPSAARRVKALLSGRLGAAEREQARAHLRACAACRSLYDRAATAEHAASGGAAVLGPVARARVQAWLGGAARGRAEKRRAVPLFAALAAAAALALVVIVARPSQDDADWQARGGGSASEVQVGVRVFRLVAEGEGYRAAPLDGAPARVRRGDSLGLAYSNDGGFAYLTWAVASSRGVVVLDEASRAVRSGVRDEPIDVAVPVDERFGVGSARLYALFSSAPLAAASLVASLPRGELPEVLPGQPPSAQRSLALEVSP